MGHLVVYTFSTKRGVVESAGSRPPLWHGGLDARSGDSALCDKHTAGCAAFDVAAVAGRLAALGEARSAFSGDPLCICGYNIDLQCAPDTGSSNLAATTLF